MSKPHAAHAPFAARMVPPQTGMMPIIAKCEACGRFAFGVIETTQPALVGQKATSRLLGTECPWCLTITQHPTADTTERLYLPLDMATQVRTALTTAAPATDSASGEGLIDSGENDAKPEAEGTEAAEARGDA